MNRIAVDSTTLTWAAYSPQRRLLQLGFQGGSIYAYFDVPPRTYHELLSAQSKGRYFNFHIRNHFQTEAVNTLSAGKQN